MTKRISLLIVVVAALVGGCASRTADSEPSTTVVTVTSPATSSATGAPPSHNGTAQLRRSFSQLAASLPGAATVSVAAVGSSRSEDIGRPSNDVAWSTIKVPLAMAARKANVPSVASLSRRAIVDSDNAAAEQLFAELGDPVAAAAKVDAVLVSGGDTGTHVQSQRIRPEFTAFGQTRWSGVAQARFAAHLPCIGGGADMLSLMRNVSGTQQWGLVSLPGAAVKGGWGPDSGGGYLVRQLAVVDGPRGQIAFALSARPNSGQQADGNAMLTTIAGWIRSHLADFPAGTCPGPGRR